MAQLPCFPGWFCHTKGVRFVTLREYSLDDDVCKSFFRTYLDWDGYGIMVSSLARQLDSERLVLTTVADEGINAGALHDLNSGGKVTVAFETSPPFRPPNLWLIDKLKAIPLVCPEIVVCNWMGISTAITSSAPKGESFLACGYADAFTRISLTEDFDSVEWAIEGIEQPYGVGLLAERRVVREFWGRDFSDESARELVKSAAGFYCTIYDQESYLVGQVLD